MYPDHRLNVFRDCEREYFGYSSLRSPGNVNRLPYAERKRRFANRERVQVIVLRRAGQA